MYHFPREKPSEDSAEQIPRERDAEMVEARQGTLNIACYDYQHDGTTCHYNSVGKRPAGYQGTLLFRDPGSRQTTSALQQRVLEEAPAASEAHAERSAKRRKSEKQVRHVEGAAARATGALANEPSSHSAGAAELTRDRVSFSSLSKKELDAFEKQFPSFCCPLCTSPLT